MSRRYRNLILSMVIAMGLGAGAMATPTSIGSVTITGGEQSSGSTWDSGTVTATINGMTVTVSYGQGSSSASIASGLAAAISKDCNMPVYAHAIGTVISFYQRGSNVMNSVSISSSSNNSSMFSSNSFLANGVSDWSPPQIIQLSLTEGPPSMGFTISGANFGSAQGIVTIGNIPATILSWSADGTTIVVQVPVGLAAGPVNVQVETAEGGAFNLGTYPFTVDIAFVCN